MDTDSFNVHVKSENIYAEFADNVKKRFNNWNIKLKLKKIKDKLGGRIILSLYSLYSWDQKVCKECLETTKSAWRKIKQYWNHSKGSEVSHTIYSLKESTRFNSPQMMVKDHKIQMESSQIHMVQVVEQCAKNSWWNTWSILMMLQEKIHKTMVHAGHKFPTIHTTHY